MDRSRPRGERAALGFGLGITGLGLVTLILGRLGILTPWPIRLGLVLLVLAEGAGLVRDRRRNGPEPDLDFESVPDAKPARPPRLLPWLGFGLAAGPFLVIIALGAMLPTIDFDAIEYHLQGPKEYFQAGRIAFLPHNVYTSMPFGVEMLPLLGMVVLNDWWWGALVGPLLVASSPPRRR